MKERRRPSFPLFVPRWELSLTSNILLTDGRLLIGNAEKRKRELVDRLAEQKLSRREALVLRGRLGFAKSFMHGRLGRLVLSRIIEHAYGTQTNLSEPLIDALSWMKHRLANTRPREVNSESLEQFFLFTDAPMNLTRALEA